MTRRAIAGAAVVLALAGLPHAPASATAPKASRLADAYPQQPDTTLTADLDRVLDAPELSRALVAARVESLVDGRVLYSRHADTLVVPGSNMKILTVAVAAERLGLSYRFETRLDAEGEIVDGTLRGDLVVTGTGDPSIGSPDDGHAAVFLEWAEALHRAGIHHVAGRIVGDDNAFDDRELGPGWAWDYLAYGYAAPAGALNYNENAAVLRITAGAAEGRPASVRAGPPGHPLDVRADVTTTASGSAPTIVLERFPGRPTLLVRGSVPRSGAAISRTAAVDNPTRFFVEALRLALASRGIAVDGGAWDIDDLPPAAAPRPRQLVARHASPPLSALAGYAMNVSQNQYAEVFLKALGRAAAADGSTEAGRRAVVETLTAWGLPADALVLHDGSGLSRYNYLTALAIVRVLRHVWEDERLRGPFVSWLPIGGAAGGTLETRMRGTPLAGRVQAKTGTISNVRALSGILTTRAGEKLAFAIVANHYTASNGRIDAIVDEALNRLAAAAPTAIP
ncbi:MAG: D-alanyl-D-alanine carboxypeptidase/D-alanyl-D-alanine-endopeptidase [Acidobacteria bacterium]|nr:D-alanyl-D-alanine carboxypeptidase/D-alanyl-D-alanine-endopeptidase [Acidobacteriota bacterium]